LKILYGVTGEGLGHAMRARTIAEHLRSRGHDVLLAASGGAQRVLARHFDHVLPIEGFELRYGRGTMRRGASLAHNLARSPRCLRHNLGSAFRQAVRFAPDVVLTDFESFAHAVGVYLGRPIVSIDHHHVIDRFVHPRAVLDRLPRGFGATRAIVRAKTPGCAHYIVTSFFAPEPRPTLAQRTTLVGPILRSDVEERTATRGDHILVYQTSQPDPALVAALLDVREARFIVYARGTAAAQRVRNVEIRPFHEQRFLDDLATARGVVAHGGHTALSEALVLGKPVLSIPLRHQGEQELNAAYLEALGYGFAARRPSPAVVRRFVESVDGRAQIVERGVRVGTSEALSALDRVLEETA
jgi:uncharacterized protein (TIGR00661 family)